MRVGLVAWVALPCAAIALRLAGVRRLAPRGLRAPTVFVDPARARTIAASVHHAARFWRSSCLTRAVVIGWLLARTGLDARLTIGVAGDPFAAHAWLEHAGLMLAGASPVRTYAPLCRIDAGADPAFVSAVS